MYANWRKFSFAAATDWLKKMLTAGFVDFKTNKIALINSFQPFLYYSDFLHILVNDYAKIGRFFVFRTVRFLSVKQKQVILREPAD